MQSDISVVFSDLNEALKKVLVRLNDGSFLRELALKLKTSFHNLREFHEMRKFLDELSRVKCELTSRGFVKTVAKEDDRPPSKILSMMDTASGLRVFIVSDFSFLCKSPEIFLFDNKSDHMAKASRAMSEWSLK